MAATILLLQVREEQISTISLTNQISFTALLECVLTTVENYCISIASDPHSGSLHKITETGAPCTSLPPQKISRTSRAHNNTQWTDVDCVPNAVAYSGLHGEVQGVALGDSVEFFLHYIDSKLTAKMQRNKFICHIKVGTLWASMTQLETKHFLAIFLHMCINQRPNTARDRFLNILSMFHLTCKSQEKEAHENGFDAPFKVRYLLQKLTEIFQKTC